MPADATAPGGTASGTTSGTAFGIVGIDHVSLPMERTDAMVAFYRALGFDVVEQKAVVSVHAGTQMINFHRPEVWRRDGFTLRAPAAVPPCGDVCVVWEGSSDALHARLADAGVEVEEGPVERVGGRKATATSVYVRDPDGNLLELMIYPTTPHAPNGAAPTPAQQLRPDHHEGP